MRGHKDLTPTAEPQFRPVAGPIAILPREKDVFADAVRTGGGTVAPLSPETRGIVWLTYGRSDELSAALDENPGIEWVQLPWAGVDAFAPLLASYADHDRLLFTSAKGAYSEPVAEHALALTLATLRQLPQKSRQGSWMEQKTGISLYGLNVVVVGAGGIAVEILRLLSAFDTDVTVVRRSTAPLAGAARTVTASQLHEVLPTADVVILAAASTDDTRHLIGAPELALMKNSAVLVNIARGPLVDQDALAAALAADAINGAGLDVTTPEPLPAEHALWSLPNCIITSHSADTPPMTEPLLANRIARNVEAFLGGSPFTGIVDPKAGY
jgi:phosphoglycerate dehydrogenase-like enzyme